MDSIKNLFYVFTDKLLFIEWLLEIIRHITIRLLKIKAKIEMENFIQPDNKEDVLKDLRKVPEKIKKHLIYDEEVLKMRWDLCSKCEFLNDGNQCEKCGCYMKIKHKLAPASCPIGKWNPHNPQNPHELKENYNSVTNI